MLVNYFKHCNNNNSPQKKFWFKFRTTNIKLLKELLKGHHFQ